MTLKSLSIDIEDVVAIRDDKRDIKGCEIAVSDKAKCIFCKNTITIGTPRLWVIGSYKCVPPEDEGIKKIRRFICYKCGKRLIQNRDEHYEKQITQGQIAQIKKKELAPIHNQFLKYLEEPGIKDLIKADEIMRELEKKE
jgi:hypothetical protein